MQYSNILPANLLCDRIQRFIVTNIKALFKDSIVSTVSMLGAGQRDFELWQGRDFLLFEMPRLLQRPNLPPIQ